MTMPTNTTRLTFSEQEISVLLEAVTRIDSRGEAESSRGGEPQ